MADFMLWVFFLPAIKIYFFTNNNIFGIRLKNAKNKAEANAFCLNFFSEQNYLLFTISCKVLPALNLATLRAGTFTD